jgi:hypothetical protein
MIYLLVKYLDVEILWIGRLDVKTLDVELYYVL